MKKLIIYLTVAILCASCGNSNNSDNSENSEVIDNSTINFASSFHYLGTLKKVEDVPESCQLMTEENIKKWYGIDEVKFLTKPMGMGIPKSCNTAFFAKDISTTLSIQVYDFESKEDYETAVELMDGKALKKISRLGDAAYWDGNSIVHKSLSVYQDGLRFVVTLPLKDAYTAQEHENRALQIMNEYLNLL